MAFEARRAEHWHEALRRDLLDISPALVYDPVAGGNTAHAPLLRELRSLQAQIRRSQREFEYSLLLPVWQRRRSLSGALHSRALPTALTELSVDPRRVIARLQEIAGAARNAIRLIERSRRYRDAPTPDGGATLYQAHDVPRRAAWQRALHGAQRMVRQLRDLPGTSSPQPRRASNRDNRNRTELPLSTLYERWVFLRIVRAFQERFREPAIGCQQFGLADLESAELEGIRFQRGDRIIRIRLEPWIAAREIAIAEGHALYRPGPATLAWRPDIVVQVEAGSRAHIPLIESAYIIDAKTSTGPPDEVWERVSKYRRIRASRNDSRVVRLVALALPTAQAPALPAALKPYQGPQLEWTSLSLLPGDTSDTGSRVLHDFIERVLADM
jgi:hypothetical protein